MTDGSPTHDGPGVAVVGAEHLHLIEIVERLVEAGARTVAHTPDGSLIALYEGWRAESASRPFSEILADDDVEIVVTAGVPSDRADVALAAIDAGKWVVSDKPGVTTRAQLAAIRTALDDRQGRPWTVVFSERLGNRAVAAAVDLARAGAIGRVVHVIGSGPHSLYPDQRPAWFWEPERTGGILVDIGSHQIDQYLASVGPDAAAAATVTSASVGNVAAPQHPDMQDIGAVVIEGDGVRGDHRVDYLTAAGLGAWGDTRLTIVGTEGTLEVRANVDVAGAPGAEHLLLVDHDGARRVDVAGHPVDWAELLLADVADGGERLMTQAHVLRVCELSLDAQERATGWGDPT